MVEMVWHRRETRRQQRRQTSTCTTRRTRSTHQKLGGSAQLTTSAIQAPMRGRTMDFQFDEKKLRFVQRVLNNRVLFKIVLLFQVPMNFMIGMRLRELNEESCKVSVPYRWLNKNPFKSTFWAVLGMAGGVSTGALVMMYTYKLAPSVSIIVGDCSGEFIAKARDLTP